MKIKKITFALAGLTVLFAGCGSAPKNTNEPKTAAPVEVQQKNPDEDYLNSLKNFKITVTQTPKITNVNKKFNTSYAAKVLNSDNTPAANCKITIEYPASKDKNTIVFARKDETADANGIITFTPDIPYFAANDKVYFYLSTESENPETIDAAKKAGASAEWKVRSDIISKGAILFIWDYNEKDRPVNNSYEILSEFRSRGMTMTGNAPVNETSYIGKPLSTLYKLNYEIVENSYGYLIAGTVKFVKPVEQVENGYLCSLTAEISAVNMKTGEVIFTKTYNNEAVGTNWAKATGKCKEDLSKIIVDDIVYGL